MTKLEIVKFIYDIYMLKLVVQSFFLKKKYINSRERILEEKQYKK